MGGITVIDPLAEVLPEPGVPQVPEVGQVRGEVVLLLLRHHCQFFLNLFQRHTDSSLAGTPSKGKGSVQGLARGSRPAEAVETGWIIRPLRVAEIGGAAGKSGCGRG